MGILFDQTFVVNIPFALTTSFIVHAPEDFVLILPFFMLQAPVTFQVLEPVELDVAINEVE
jgi:hypothetical protein